MKKKPFYVVTWGNDGLTPGSNYMICDQAKDLKEASRKIKNCNERPNSGKGHRVFLVKEVQV